LSGSTIAALATSCGLGAISVIRMSGADALAICDGVFRGKVTASGAPDRSVTMGDVVAADGSVIDQVLVLVMRGPKSFTGEDVVEISCHGGLAPRLVLRRLIEMGAEPAEAGEFTKRAFLNGKMDLAQAEAVADIVRAGSERALKAAVRQLKGDLSDRFRALEAALFQVLTMLEADIDFPDEEDTGGLDLPSLVDRLRDAGSGLENLLAAHERGKHLHHGLDVAIVGKPNVGKSSIFNRLVGEDRVITSDVPGTTRDVVDGVLSLDGIVVHLHDTAGVRVPCGALEEAAVARSRRAVADADLALIVIDASKPLTEEDREVLGSAAYKPHLIVVNKTDLPMQADFGPFAEAIRMSALRGWGLPDLLEGLRSSAHAGLEGAECDPMVSERHAACIRAALESLRQAAGSARKGLSYEFIAADVRCALDSLGMVTGRKVAEGVLDEIFSRFCIGK
jgi:tRNA modification GTPase